MDESQETKRAPLVMIVDDDRFSRNVLSKIIAEAGYEVLQTCDGNEAANLYPYAKPDVVLMDGEMPVMDGISACRLIKQQAGAEDVPVLFVTSHSEAEFVERAFAAGAEDLITKPVNTAMLRRRLQRVIDNRRITKELRCVCNELLTKVQEHDRVKLLLEEERQERQRLEALLAGKNP